jgi:hypothetical protein
MNAPTCPVTENVADLDSGITEDDFPKGDDLAISRATDFYRPDELLTEIWGGLVGEHCIGTSQSRYHEGTRRGGTSARRRQLGRGDVS